MRHVLASLFAAVALLVTTTFSARSAPAVQLRVVLASDTRNWTRMKPEFQANHEVAKEFFSQIGKLIRAETKIVEVTGENYTCAGLAKAVEGLPGGENAILVFYNSGDGTNAGNQSKFPSLECGNPYAPNPEPPIALENIFTSLKAKPNRIVMAVADSCNVVPVPAPPAITQRGLAPYFLSENAIRSLFLDYKGSLIAGGARVGQFSIYPAGGVGYFTRRFTSAVREIQAAAEGTLWTVMHSRLSDPITLSPPFVQATTGSIQSAQEPIVAVDFKLDSAQR